MRWVTVFGGTGFLGRHIVKRLNGDGMAVRVAVRHPQRAPDAAASGAGPIVSIEADVRDETAVANAVAGVDAVVNAVSAYVEKGEVTYSSVHELGALNVARACKRQGVHRLIHISGISADGASHSKYIRARGRGDLAVQQAFPRAVILRPSVMFGHDDAFLNALAKIVRLTPIIPLIGGGLTRLQPVHVDDVAEAALHALQITDSAGKTYELCGPETHTLRQIVEMVASRLGRRRLYISIPLDVAHSLARFFEHLPVAPLTVAQVDLLREDNVLTPGVPGLSELGITPRRLQDSIAELAATP
jgi:uncharacterized protein YbjT (DUF2867 family)